MAAVQVMSAKEKEDDDIMRQIFHGVAMRTAGVRGASKVLVQGEIYHLCPACVYKGIPDADEAEQPESQFIPYDEELPCLTTSELTGFRPEVLLDCGAIPITQDSCPELLTADPDIWIAMCKKAPSGDPGMLLLKKQEQTGVLEILREEPFPDASFFHTMPLKLSSIPSEVASTLVDYKTTLARFTSDIRRAKLKDVLVLMMRSATGMLYVTTNMATEPKTLDNVFSPVTGLTYCGDGWDDKLKSFKNLVRKKGVKKMKGLPNPTIGRNAKAAPLPPPKAHTEEPAEADGIPMGEAADTVAAAKIAVPLPKPVSKPEAEVEPEQPAAAELAKEVPDTDQEVNEAMEQAQQTEPENVQDTSQEVTAQPDAVEDNKGEETEQLPQSAVEQPKEQKRQRRRKEPSKVGFDFTEVLEYTSSPVDDIQAEDIEKAEAEMRNLRDLMIAASRRMANIALKITETSKDAVISMAKVQELLGGRK